MGDGSGAAHWKLEDWSGQGLAGWLISRARPQTKAEALNKLGLTYCDIGYDLRAIDYFEQSLVICEDNADMHGQAVCLQHLGNVFKMQKDNNLAVDAQELVAGL